MFYYLSGALKRRLILEIQDSFSKHPVYNKAVPFIQNKFSFKERPQFGVVVKGASTNKLMLSAQNYLGIVQSYVMLAYVGQPTYLLEWAKEDANVIRNNGGVPPTPPGVYYVECLTAPTSVGEKGTFVIDPLLTVTNEVLLKAVTGIESGAQLRNVPLSGTVRLWENQRNVLLEGRDYTIDSKGYVSIVGRLIPGSVITADYRYPVASIGPIEWSWNTADFKTLPGVVLAFGKRGSPGDKLAVVVYDDRVDSAEAYGGKFEISFNFDVIAQDPIQMEEMADYLTLSLWGEKRSRLSTEGLEMIDISMGGEEEESYDENADIYFFTASMSAQFQADWEMHKPLPFTLSRGTTVTVLAEKGMSPDRTGTTPSGIKAYSNSGLQSLASPIFVGRNVDYERIGG